MAQESAPSKAIPNIEEINRVGEPDARKALRTYSDWLLANRTEGGFLNRNSSAWYRVSYPIRTLIAAYHVCGERRYLEGATVCLDWLVTEQLPNGAWTSGFHNRPVAQRSEEEIRAAMSGTTNTADVGCISTCLAVAYPYVDRARKAEYLGALRRYCDTYAAQWQLPSGAFTNARWKGADMAVPYSVATGTQGMNFCALHAITGERRYLEVAERAARFLLSNWQEDGRPIHHHHCEDRQQVHDVTAFGDIFYYHEAILWVWHWTADEDLKDDIRRVYAWHIKGTKGLIQALENGVWWPVGHVWTNAKAAAMPLVLIEYARSMADDAEVDEAVRRCIAFLCAPEFASRIGVMCDPGAPWGDFGASSTGFGGLALAERIEPGVIYLKAKHGRPWKRQADSGISDASVLHFGCRSVEENGIRRSKMGKGRMQFRPRKGTAK